ncbi:hypothetical protein T440DRAFT_156812 [Plenodomus tracheiphilus IPT5]|uniref:Uncharacterized protein n=1 Tax=Plenodomus tracheiphilus IPT5 TaxID=1408161 RepID=A0A6A7BJV9_9PLEO|nr:hypothetical protein T440DRAFT_156812 [Plenodomus tracheiphilus IPT5]
MDARLQDFRSKMQSVKELYHSRHYTQCAKFAGQLLAETNERQIHPIHLSYLYFYTALSHDTLAREATLKNRHKELSLAEKHYLAAITALTPPSPTPKQPDLDAQNDSPISATFHDSHLWKRRSSNAGSFDSTASTASSATSYSYTHSDDDQQHVVSHKRGESFQFPRPPGLNDHLNSEPKTTRHHNPIYISSYTPSRLACYTTTHEYDHQDDEHPMHRYANANANHVMNPLASQISSFATLLNAHLNSVRSLKKKTSVHAVRFTFPSPKPSPTAAAAAAREKARASHVYDCAEAEGVRQMRRNRVFRQRFDPEAVRRLCGDVLAELA